MNQTARTQVRAVAFLHQCVLWSIAVIDMNKPIPVLLVAGFLAAVAHIPAQAAISPEIWAKEDVLNVGLSRNASYISIMRAIDAGEKGGMIEVYSVGDGSTDSLEIVRRVDADPMEITGMGWISDKHFIMNLRQQVRHKIDGFNQGVYEFKYAIVNVETGDISSFEARNAALAHVLPKDPNKVIISYAERDRFGLQYYEIDLEKGGKRLVIRGSIAKRTFAFDADGNPRFSSGFDSNSREFVSYYRAPGKSGWAEINRSHIDDFDTFSVLGMDPDPQYAGHAFVLAHNGQDTAGVWSFNLETRKFVEPLYARKDRDVAGVRYHSNNWSNPDLVVGFVALLDKPEYVYLDAEEEALYKQLEELIPNAFSFTITSRSAQGDSLIIRNTGPKDPTTFYWYHKGKFSVVGSRQPELPSDELADVELISYAARDGMKIPAFVTIPNGEKPFPLVVLPHGGPYVSEFVTFDPWAQLLANHGYMVIQPSYRGTQRLGLKHYKAAFEEKSEAGYAMQDDLDDGALALVERGLADKDRLAMFGWSYGGYTSLVAAMRTPQIYQCTIAGAAVSDPIMQVNYYRDFLRGSQRAEQLTTWAGAFSPVDEIDKINVPMLVIHGDNDQRVPVDHSRKLAKKIRENDNFFKYVELEETDHFYSTLMRRHRQQLYTEMLAFLENDCGPGGL